MGILGWFYPFPGKSSVKEKPYLIKIQALDLCKKIQSFLNQRVSNQPERNYNDIDKKLIYLNYFEDIMIMYQQYFLPKVKILYNEFVILGKTDLKLEFYIEHTVNIETISKLVVHLEALAKSF